LDFIPHIEKVGIFLFEAREKMQRASTSPLERNLEFSVLSSSFNVLVDSMVMLVNSVVFPPKDELPFLLVFGESPVTGKKCCPP